MAAILGVFMKRTSYSGHQWGSMGARLAQAPATRCEAIEGTRSTESMKRWAHRFRRPTSIRSRLILLVLSILVPALLTGWWVMSLSHRLAREANQALLEDT